MANKPYPLYETVGEMKTMRDLVTTYTNMWGDKIAYSFREGGINSEKTQISFRRMGEDVAALGTEFCRRGVSTGTHCALIGKLSYGWVLSYLSLLSIGAVAVPLDPDWTTVDLADVLQKSECTYLICDPETDRDALAAAAGIAPEHLFGTKGDAPTSVPALTAQGADRRAAGDTCYEEAVIRPEELGLLVYTSGTTGKGKGVMLSQKNILSDINGGMKIIKLETKMIGVLPPHHTFGSTICILGPLCLGYEVYISAGLRYFLKELQLEQPDGLILVPLYLETFYRKIRAELEKQKKTGLVAAMMHLSNGLRHVGIDLTGKLFAPLLRPFGGKLRTVITGGAPLNPEIFRFFTSLGIKPVNGYGITECSPLISCNRNYHIVPGTVGMPIPEDEIKIESPNENGEGEICVRGPNVMMGYYHDEEATRAAIDGEGFFHTGDIGKLHRSGYLMITGRLKNLIILTNGKNVYPEEIEAEFAAVPGVEDVVVYEGESRRGVSYNRIVAEFYMDEEYRSNHTEEESRQYLSRFVDNYNRGAVAYKKIETLKVRTEPFPKNTLRKIMRFRIDRSVE